MSDTAENRNVVLITYDSLRADHCGPWGYDRDTTPNLDAMANEGVVFKNAIAPASRTNPSMAGIFTGEPMVVRDQVANPEYARRHLKRHGTIAEELSEAGYATGAFCPNAYSSRYYGFDRGFDTYEDFLFNNSLYQDLFDKHLGDSSLFTIARNIRNFVRRQEAFKTWDTYIEQMVEWVENQSEPFFLWAFSLDTHFPYLTPRKYRTWSNLWDQYYYNYRCNQLINQFEIDLSKKERQKLIDIYDDSIRFGDVLIAELQERLDEFDPVFVVHGDHGEAFDERGIYGHFFPLLYEENIHVPLVVSGIDESSSVERPVSLLEVPELLRRVSGLSEGEVADLDQDWVVATDYDGRNDRNLTAIRTRRLKCVVTENGGRAVELFNFVTEGEFEDLYGSEPPFGEALEDLARRREEHEQEIIGIRDAVRQLDSVSE